MKDGLVASARDLEDEGLVSALGGEVEVDALSEFGGVDPDDVVLAANVGGRAAEDVGADLLLVNLGAAFDERLAADVEEKIPQPCRSSELLTRGNALDEISPFFDRGRIIE